MAEKDTESVGAHSNGADAHGQPQSPSTSSPETNHATSTKQKRTLLPSWLTTALRTKRTWKNWARSMVALLAVTLLMVIQKTSTALGSTGTFFGLLTCAILPPMMPFSVFLFALLTLGLGMLLGWAWGTAAWAAGLRARDAALLQTTMQGVQAQAQAAGANPQRAMQAAIFNGDFLDPRSSAVHGVFIFVGAYFFGWIRATKPKLVLLSLFATILLDLMCTLGPLFPYAYYMVATTLIKPAAAYMAVALVCSLLFFPQSVNHLVLSRLVRETYRPMLRLLALQERVLSTNPTHHDEWLALAVEGRGLVRGYVAASEELEGMVPMLQLEITRGRISAGQLTELVSRTHALLATSAGLGSVVGMVAERDRAVKQQMEDPLPYATSRSKAMYKHLMNAEDGAKSNLEDLLPDLKAATEHLRSAAETAFAGGIEFLDAINNSRWKKPPKDLVGPEVRQANLIRLRATLSEFRQSGNNRVLERLRDRFDPQTGQLLECEGGGSRGSPRGLFRCFQFTATLTGFCADLMDWLELIEVIELSTPRNRFQFPGKFVQEAVHVINDPSTGDGSDMIDDTDSTTNTLNGDKGADLKLRQPRDPDAGPPRNSLQKVGRGVSTVMRAAAGTNGIFALKYGIVSIALWVPAVCKTSARFYYVNRGLWALTMAQTGLGVSAGEQVFNFLQRMSGTLVGAIMGMVLWYIGAQRGPGNAYGVTAAFVVGMAPFLFLRIAAPPNVTSFYVMTGVTIAFVVGYSWVDNHAVQLVHLGVGFSLAGRRALLVIIGFAAAFVMTLIPRPTSSKKLLRQGIAKNINALGGLYSIEVGMLEAGRTSSADSAAKRPTHREHYLRIFNRLHALHERFEYAAFEPSLRGPWPRVQYERLMDIQGSMLSSAAVLVAAYSQLEPAWCALITDQNALMHPAFVADIVSLFTILAQSLRRGTPLPPIIPIFERVAYHQTYQHALRRAANAQGHEGAGDTDGVVGAEAVALESLESELTWENAHDEQFGRYATTLVALSHFIGGVNALHMTVLALVGQHEIDGFADAQERWARAEMAV
ncbi:hypothetical protein CspeluHIS016_0114120 [Cutaneotrichosporon spelunceum]|uniref:ER transporter 6TM N-terminal domain-containing protein n=1 Tax=Cutaneotrichosporon spelunceum TaxID=1672016 RepID=A0AAD3TQS5_9TREE|nr:hypothetical protein CspeluHIS016_0114120 [Cutaneotrichosporon spelunceum]